MTEFNHTPEQARALWCEALRSGKYKQGRDRLCTKTPEGEERFCCLGVACEVFMQHEPGHIAKQGDYVSIYGGAGPGGSAFVLPVIVSKWLGLHKLGEYVVNTPKHSRYGSHERTSLTLLNDHLKATFIEIADAIEFNFGKASQ